MEFDQLVNFNVGTIECDNVGGRVGGQGLESDVVTYDCPPAFFNPGVSFEDNRFRMFPDGGVLRFEELQLLMANDTLSSTHSGMWVVNGDFLHMIFTRRSPAQQRRYNGSVRRRGGIGIPRVEAMTITEFGNDVGECLREQ